MGGSKRLRSPEEHDDQSHKAKMARTSQDMDTDTQAREPLLHSRIDDVVITIELRSTSKATRNDPKPPDYWKKRFQSFMADGEDAARSSSFSSAQDDEGSSLTTDINKSVVKAGHPVETDEPEPSKSIPDSDPSEHLPSTGNNGADSLR
jgi:hypothetical protein